MKKSVPLLLVLVMVISVFAFVPLRTTAVGIDVKTVTNIVGDYDYEVLADGTAKMIKYRGAASELDIPSTLDGYTVTVIGAYSFYGHTTLESVLVPNTVKTIEPNAFSNCKNLQSIRISSSVTSVGSGVSVSCPKLVSITVDKDNRVYDSRDNCNAVIETKTNTLIQGCGNTVIPDSVTSIGKTAFQGISIGSLIIPDSVKSIGDHAFYSCNDLKSIDIPDSVQTIGYAAFEDTDLIKVKLPNSLNIIEGYTFNGCADLKTIEIPDSVESIGDHAFAWCFSLTSVDLPSELTEISGSAFASCASLKSIRIPTSVTSIQSQAFISSGLETIEIPNSVTYIAASAFAQCNNLTSIIIINPSCLINTDDGYSQTIYAGATIYGYSGSTAEEYAKAYGNAFGLICQADGYDHIEVVDKGYEPTNDNTGLTDGSHCSVCNKVLVKQEIIPIIGMVLGDVDSDGEVSVMDATSIQFHIASLQTINESRLYLGDTDKDGEVSILDATQIQMFIAQLIPEL